VKIQQWLLLTAATLIIFAGCAERKNPVVSTEENAFQLLSQSQTSGWAVDISIAGDSAYVAEREGGVTIWDISDPGNLIIRDTLETSGNAKRIEFDPVTNLFLVNLDAGITYYSYVDHHGIYDPKQQFNSVGSGMLYDIAFQEVSPDTVLVAYIDDTDGLFLRTIHWDTNDTPNQWHEGGGNLFAHISLDFGKMRGLFYDLDHIYIANNEMGFAIISVDYGVLSAGFEMTLQGFVNTPGAGRDVGVNEARSHAIVADFQSGLVIIDITDIQNPEIVSTFRPEGVENAIKLAVKDNVAFFLDQYDGMFAVDVNDPLNPVLIGSYKTPRPTAIKVTDDYIFITDRDLGIIVLEWR